MITESPYKTASGASLYCPACRRELRMQSVTTSKAKRRGGQPFQFRVAPCGCPVTQSLANTGQKSWFQTEQMALAAWSGVVGTLVYSATQPAATQQTVQPGGMRRTTILGKTCPKCQGTVALVDDGTTFVVACGALAMTCHVTKQYSAAYTAQCAWDQWAASYNPAPATQPVAPMQTRQRHPQFYCAMCRGPVDMVTANAGPVPLYQCQCANGPCMATRWESSMVAAEGAWVRMFNGLPSTQRSKASQPAQPTPPAFPAGGPIYTAVQADTSQHSSVMGNSGPVRLMFQHNNQPGGGVAHVRVIDPTNPHGVTETCIKLDKKQIQQLVTDLGLWLTLPIWGADDDPTPEEQAAQQEQLVKRLEASIAQFDFPSLDSREQS